jgi:uncharacterized SAM-binding protein YcdF (DUF218 family)
MRTLPFSLILCIATLTCSCAFSPRKTLQYYLQAQKTRYDIIVVPGVPLENGKWSRTMKGRIYWAKFLFDNGITENIMFSGSAVYEHYVEGEVMALYAEAIGIPKEYIYAEKKAEHSTENIYYGYHKAKMLGFEKIALASDPFQTKSLKRFTRVKVHPSVGLIPMVIDTLEAMQEVMFDPVVDLSKARVENFTSILERESFFKRLKGTMGKNLDTTAYRK